MHTDLPQVVISTTYAGSEMTPVLGQTLDGRKSTEHAAGAARDRGAAG